MPHKPFQRFDILTVCTKKNNIEVLERKERAKS